MICLVSGGIRISDFSNFLAVALSSWIFRLFRTLAGGLV